MQLFHQHICFAACSTVDSEILSRIGNSNNEKHSCFKLRYTSSTDPLCCTFSVWCVQNVQTPHSEMVLKAFMVRCPIFRLMRIICLITTLSVNNLNYTCSHKGGRPVHSVL